MRLLLAAAIISSTFLVSSDVDDAILKLIPDRGARESIPKILRFYGNIQRDERTKEFFNYMGVCMDSFNIDELYNSKYFINTERGYKSLTFHGQNRGDYMSFELVPAGYIELKMPECGEFFSEYGLKRNDPVPGKKKKSFSFYIKSRTGWGNISLSNVLSFFEGFMKLFDPQNITKLENPPQSQVFPHLTGYNRKVCDSFFKSFPKTMTYFDKYCTAPPLLELKSYKNTDYSKIKAKLIFKKEIIKKDFPLLEEYFKEQSGMFKIKIDLMTPTGHTICKFLIDGMDSFTAEVCTQGGKIVPFDIKGIPYFNEAFSMEKIKNLDFIAEVGMDVKQFGLHVGMTMVFYGNYQKAEGKETLGYKLIDIKNIITGNLMNMVPFEVVDKMTMGNIDVFMKEYTNMLVNANNGEGTFLLHKWTRSASGKVLNNYYLSSELLDNFFIRFGMKMFGMRFEGKRDARLQMGDFLKKFFMCFIEDIEAKGIK